MLLVPGSLPIEAWLKLAVSLPCGACTVQWLKTASVAVDGAVAFSALLGVFSRVTLRSVAQRRTLI